MFDAGTVTVSDKLLKLNQPLLVEGKRSKTASQHDKAQDPNHTPDKYQTSISSPAKPPPAFPKSIQIKKFFSKLIEIMSQVLYTDSSVIYRY